MKDLISNNYVACNTVITSGFYISMKKSNNRRSDSPKRFKPENKPTARPPKAFKAVHENSNPEMLRLNKFISNAGICSRRDADKLISSGEIKVNGVIVTELGTKISPRDKVEYKGERLFTVEDPVYILMNKPKDAITTTSDPEGRRTVMDIIGEATDKRVYPVGRLDRNTTGVLLFTNDGELAQRLMHPKRNITKVYVADLDKPLTEADLHKLVTGIELEDGLMTADKAAFPDPQNKKSVGVEIHSGKNRIIHRMFESMGYVVTKLDRVLFANLDKRKMRRGEWRELTPKELKVLRASVGLH